MGSLSLLSTLPSTGMSSGVVKKSLLTVGGVSAATTSIVIVAVSVWPQAGRRNPSNPCMWKPLPASLAVTVNWSGPV